MKLRASDGALLGTFPSGSAPSCIVYDGSNIWATNWDSNTVTKIRASDGVTLGTYPTGSLPTGVGFDGANIWVANAVDDTVMKFEKGFWHRHRRRDWLGSVAQFYCGRELSSIECLLSVDSSSGNRPVRARATSVAVGMLCR